MVVGGYLLYKPLLGLVNRLGKRKISPSVISELQNEVKRLHKEIDGLKEDIRLLQQVNSETQRTNELLFPQNFDKTKTEGATVFVKDGEEKKYETIDWRSR